jgi:hypothetical protein
MTTPQQLCVPVIKNNAFPPAEVLGLVKYIDLKCYVETPQTSLNFTLTLSQLNPVLAGIPPVNAVMTFNRHLCVPVVKNNAVIPADVFNIIRYIDLERYDIMAPALVPPINLNLRHINPVLSGLPIEPATITAPNQLMVPVAKNGVFPPG